MPIEIKELLIKTVVENAPASQTPQSNTGNNESLNKQDQVIAMCIEQVMDIIKNKNER